MNPVSTRPLMRHIITGLILFASLVAESKAIAHRQWELDMAHLKKVKNLEADFTQIRNVQSWGTQVKTKGRFSLRGMGKNEVLWEITDPTYMAMKMSEEGAHYKTSKKSSEKWMPLNNPKVSQQLETVAAWLRFDSTKLAKDFEIEKLGTLKYKLVPKQESFLFKKIEIRLNKKKFVSQIIMTEKNDDSINIQFSNTKAKR